MELFRLLGRIAIENGEALSALKETSAEGGRTESKLGSAFKKIGSAAAVVGKAVAAGVAVGAAGIAAFTKSAVDAYADYEQLVGGVETLFGAGGKSLGEYAASVGKTVSQAKSEYDSLMKAQNSVLKDADNAYRTAGMSANEYMETVTSFSAALIGSLDGNTNAAAEKANRAIVDMSDNANKMGSSMEMIQNAYNGFAKQNYTMLDNLKLGYGGTKEEMARLLEDAEKLSGIEYDISSYSDVVDAIHVIQTEMGITGTTAKEASETIAGSNAAMKASWQNLVTGFGDENANLTDLVGQFTDSVVTYGQNLIPRIGVILKSIGTVVAEEVPKMMKEIPGMVEELFPELSQKFNDLFGGALEGVTKSDFVGKIKEYFSSIPEAIGQIKSSALDSFSGQFDKLSEAVQKCSDIVRPFAERYIYSLSLQFDNIVSVVSGVLIPWISTLTDVFLDIANSILTNISPALETINESFTTLQEIVSTAISEYIVPLCQDFISMVQDLWEENQDKIQKIGELFGIVFEKISSAVQFFVSIVRTYLFPIFIYLVTLVQDNMGQIQAIFQSVFDAIGGIIDFFIALFTGNWGEMWLSIGSILESGSEFIQNIFNLVKDFLVSIGTKIWSVVTNSFEDVRQSIINKLNAAKETVISVWTNIKDTIKEKAEEALSWVKEKFEAIKENISEKIENAKKIVTDKFEEIKNNISEKIENAKKIVTDKFEEIKSKIKEKVEAALGQVQEKFESIKSSISEKIEDAKKIATDKFEEIKSNIKDKVESAKEDVKQKFEDIKSGIKEKLESAKETVTGIFDDIKESISEKISSAKDTVQDMIEKIKGFFNFDWSLPKLKMPHFEVSGKFSLNPPSVPSFDIEWYKKGGIMEDPTIFGYNPATNKVMAGGEAGAEAIAPIDVLQKYVAEAVSGRNSELVHVLELILDAVKKSDEGLEDKLYNALQSVTFDINKREFARLVKAVN